jgi:hypothetical protein
MSLLINSSHHQWDSMITVAPPNPTRWPPYYPPAHNQVSPSIHTPQCQHTYMDNQTSPIPYLTINIKYHRAQSQSHTPQLCPLHRDQ